MKFLRYLLYLVLLAIATLALLIIWPKGSIAKQLSNNNVPAVAYAIIENGEVSKLEVVGDLTQGIPAKENAIFNVASVTKPVFAMIVLKLIDTGVIGLDEPLHPYWVDEDVKEDQRHKLLTPRILLSHQAGFLNWRWHYDDGKLAFNFDPGTGYQYSGEGMEYLKNAIQSKTGKLLEVLADSLLLDPLQMNDTRFIWDDDMDESRFAKWHDGEGNLYETKPRKNACAADDLMTTLDDMVLFAKHVMSGGGLSDELFNEMTTAQVAVNDHLDFGLGWERAPDVGDGEYALVHGGSDMGVRARIVVMPQSKRAFIAFTNSDNGQKIIDRIMVDQFNPGSDILSRVYAPFVWRIIHLPFGF